MIHLPRVFLFLLIGLNGWVFAQESKFSEISSTAGLPAFGGTQGIAVGDYNNDGFDDFYISADIGHNRLYRNNGDGTFVEVAESLGLNIEAKSKTAIWGDINNDGYLDLYLANLISNDQLFLNEGDGSFREITQAAGIENWENPSSVNMADVNNDGYLDIYVSNLAAENILFLNQKNLSFINYTTQSGTTDTGSSMGSIFFDYDKDGDQDLFLTHDHAEPSFLYQNDGTGHFTEVGEMANANVQGLGMGVDIGDINNDGYSDVYITNLFKNTLLLNKGNGTFENISESAGIQDYGMGWGTSFIDFDKDGWLDIYVANDSEFSPYPNVLYRNQGNNFFLPVELEEAVSSMGQSYAAICFDFQQDGMMDLAVANRGVGDHFQLFQNADRPGNWIGIKLLGKESNSSAIGSKVHIVDEQGLISYKELTAGQGWAGQNSNVLYFGLGQAATLDSVTVFWPSGLVQPLSQLKLNRYYTVEEGASPREGIIGKPLLTSSPLLQNENRNLVLDVFPNPSTGKVVLHTNLTKPTPLQLNVFNVLGKLLYTQYIEPKLAQNQTWELNFLRLIQEKHLILQLKTPDEVVSKRLILQP